MTGRRAALRVESTGFGVSRGLIGGIALSTGALMLLLLGMLSRSRRRPQSTGPAELMAMPAVALADFQGRGKVRARGEVWQALSAAPVQAGQRLRVTGIEGLVLRVEAEPSAPAPDNKEA